MFLLSRAMAAFAVGLLATATSVAGRVDMADRSAIQTSLNGLAMPFEANLGQYDTSVAFSARTFAGSLFVTRNGKIVHALAGAPVAEAPTQERRPLKRGPGWSLSETLYRAEALSPTPGRRADAQITRFHGNDPSLWRSAASTYHSVQLGRAWPGISVELAARGSNVEKLFTVAPGASAAPIAVTVGGATFLRLGKSGELIVGTGNGDIAFTPPIAYQEANGQRSNVPVRYRLLAQNRYGFVLGSYDRSQPLVIDPLLQSTYLGGSSNDFAYAVASAGNGDVLVAGYAGSTDFPGTAGGAQAVWGGGSFDGFVARLSGDLKTLLRSTYLGGSNNDAVYALGVAGNGDVLVAGYTGGQGFPIVAGAAQAVLGGSADAFVARLSADLTTLLHSTFLGGADYDSAGAIALAGNGDVLVTGYTRSADFPTTAGGAQAANAGNTDAFVARLSGDLTTLQRSTYLGGTSNDYAYAIALASNGDVLVGGYCDAIGFPGVAGGAQSASAGGDEAFVARLSGDLQTLQRSTYLGGSNGDSVYAVAIAGNGDVLVAGITDSVDFPGTAGAAQPAAGGGGSSGFVARLSGDLQTLQRSTYLGGSNTDYVNAIVLTGTGDVLVAGVAGSADFPGTAGAAQPASGGGTNAFVARFSSDLTTLQRATYLGGSNYDFAQAIALAGNGDVLVAGFAGSTDFPGTAGGAQPAIGLGGGGPNAFIARLTANLLAFAPPVPAQLVAVPALGSGALALLALLLGGAGVRLRGHKRRGRWC